MMNRHFALISLLSLLIPLGAGAAINSQFAFESGVPNFVKVEGEGTVTSSQEKFKDGASSLKFGWSGPSSLVFSNFLDMEASMKVSNAGIIVWLYNTAPSDGALRFTFWNWSGEEICHFDFRLPFSGWRTAWVKYVDMLTPDGGHYGDIPSDRRPVNVAKMTISTPEGVSSGTVYLDRMSFTKNKLHDQIVPDMQIPDNNYQLRENMWQWCQLWEWEQYPDFAAQPLTGSQAQMLEDIEQRLQKRIAAYNSSDIYVKNTLLKRADDMYVKYALGRLPDGSVKGAPLLSDDEFNNSLGEMRINFIGRLVYYYAQDYYYTGSKANLDRAFVAMDHAIDQGFAYGSGLGTNHHYGYQIRELYRGMWLLRDEIQAAGKTEEYLKVLEYWSGLAEARKPFVYGRDEILDSWNTLLEAKVISAMLTPSPEKRYAKMKALSEWVSGSMCYSPGTLGGFKPDGTSFHHGGHYPAYSVGAFAALGDFCKYVRGTDFVISEPARRVFKHVLLTMAKYCNLTDWGVGICGRHPFNGFIPKADIEAFASLALLGDLTSSGKTADPELGGTYLYLGGSDSESVSALKKAKISASAAPEGFFVLNYAALGIHRRGNWMLSLKAYNSDVWSAEIYAADNRYGRYQSYGTAQLIGSGKPVSAASSGYSQEGWDWNRMPGATSIHLPFDKLDSPLPGTLMERNTSRFPGVSSLEGRNGVMAFTYVERDRENFCAGATATKSVFCFDNRIVFLGSGISNNSTWPTETTIYQLRIEDKMEEVDVNEEWFDTFPLSYKFASDAQAVITDTKGNAYILKSGAGLNILKQTQKSPSDTRKAEGTGDFITAYIDHGTSPKDASYEYMMLVQPSTKDLGKFSKELPYSVLRQDNTAHIVNDHITGITAYVCYKAYASDAPVSSGAALPVVRVDAETIVMERPLGDGSYVASVCTPDLGITQKAYTTSQPSQPLVKEMALEGSWELASGSDAVTLIQEGGRTLVKATCIDGQPVEFILRRK